MFHSVLRGSVRSLSTHSALQKSAGPLLGAQPRLLSTRALTAGLLRSWQTPVLRPLLSSLSSAAQRSLSTVIRESGTSLRSVTQSAGSTSQVIAKPGQRAVGWWLLGNAALVFGTVVVGGITRLTESGLSMVEWRPLMGILPPTSEQEWNRVFAKYQEHPEYNKLFPDMDLDHFKRIFFWEYSHRMLGRAIGLAFTLPLAYFWARGYVRGADALKCLGLAAGIGAQGLLGWYMVRSGLEDQEDRHWIPRVSQYRLAAHLGSAFVLYTGMLSMGLNRVLPPILEHIPKRGALMGAAHGLATLTFLTAISGAFVAGLDAGLVYNSFPLMGERFVPEGYITKEPLWKNMLENDAAVQFNHRCLGITTASAVGGFWMWSRRLTLPSRIRMLINLMGGVACAQVALGISTLLLLVPVPLAAAHQAGSLSLLSVALWLSSELRRLPK